MITKLFELRDRLTFIPLMAVKVTAENEGQHFLISRCGYSTDPEDPAIIITKLGGEGTASADPYSWGDRTFTTAHLHLIEHFDELEDGAVLDVEFIRKEVRTPKRSERFGG